MAPKPKYDFRDVSPLIKKLREFLLGRKHNLHGRFPPQVSTRTYPQPDIPRGPEDKYSDNYYYMRSAVESIKPPVVAPVAEGFAVPRDPNSKPQPGFKPDSVTFNCAPAPGLPWWWDGHSYYQVIDDPPSKCRPSGETTCSPKCESK